VADKKRRGNPNIESMVMTREQREFKESEPTVDNHSQWIEKSKMRPALRRVMDMPCWPDAELQLMAGMPLGDVARYIQADRGEGKWLSRYSLTRYLEELRAEAPVLSRIVAFGPLHGERLSKRFSQRTANLQILWNQICELESKIHRLLAREQITGVEEDALPTHWGTLVKLIGQAHSIQKDLGLVAPELPDVPGGLDVEIYQRVRARAGEDAANALMDPAAQGRVLEALRRAMQAAGLPGSGLDRSTDYQYRTVDVPAEEAEDE
jgi:hypothetical protein